MGGGFGDIDVMAAEGGSAVDSIIAGAERATNMALAIDDLRALVDKCQAAQRHPTLGELKEILEGRHLC